MNNLENIIKTIEFDLKQFDIYFNEIIKPEEPELNDFINYIFSVNGKKIRPILIYTTAKLFGKPTITTHRAAVITELIHTATLLHDDVVDNAKIRRGRLSANAKWDNNSSILLGDLLFAKAMKCATDNKEYKLFDIITPAIINLSSGELIQNVYSKKFTADLDLYYKIINYKTASLLSVCCEAAAYSVNATENEIQSAKKLGELLGIIFQIKDDILDYDRNNNSGKELGIDLKEGKVTLPVITACNNMSKDMKAKLISLWNSKEKNNKIVNEIINIVVDNNGITESEEIMIKHKKEAITCLNNFKDTDIKLLFIELLDYIISRNF